MRSTADLGRVRDTIMIVLCLCFVAVLPALATEQQLDAMRYKGEHIAILEHPLILEQLLNQAPPEAVRTEFQRVCDADVPEFCGKDNKFDKNYDPVLLQALLRRSVAQRDAQHLRTLLSRHCPRYAVYSPVEFFLAYKRPGSIEHLFACSVSATSPGVRKDAVFCLGRAFPAIRARFPADGDFIHQAQSWYEANHSGLQVNTMYEYLPALPPPLPREDRTNLFIFKPK